MSGNDSLQRRHLVLCLIVLQWNYWPWVIGRYASDFAWYMSQLILVFYGYCWEICQWFSMVYVSSSFISPRAAVGRYASGLPWYMSQCLSIFIVFFLYIIISLMLYLFHLSYQVIETYEVSFDTTVVCTPHNTSLALLCLPLSYLALPCLNLP